MVYEVCIHKTYMGVRDFGGGKRTAIWSQWTEETEKERKQPRRVAVNRINQKERDLRRLIKWKPGKHDYWMTVTYRKEKLGPTWSEMIKDIQKLIKYWEALPYNRKRAEVHIPPSEKSKRLRISSLVNRVQSQTEGRISFFRSAEKRTYQFPIFEDLAEYIAKPMRNGSQKKQNDITRHESDRKEPKRKSDQSKKNPVDGGENDPAKSRRVIT